MIYKIKTVVKTNMQYAKLHHSFFANLIGKHFR